ncbi:MAG: sigma 54-interacting transcriptional regulator [Candidatus Sulfotelmatobacter sp.]
MHVPMNADLLSLDAVLEKALEVAKCPVGCLVLRDLSSDAPDHVVECRSRGLEKPEDRATWRDAFLRHMQAALGQFECRLDITTIRGEMSIDGGTPVPGVTVVLLLLKRGSVELLLLLNFPGEANPPAHLSNFAVDLRRDCLVSIERYWLRSPPREETLDLHLVGNSDAFHRLEAEIRRVARNPSAPVLITGERGSGKEVVARAIHYWGPRQHKPFLAVNCAALQQELYAAEMFGYRKGAFTGAIHDRLGKFRAAAGGTLFLDEITEIPTGVAGGLLRALDLGEIQSLGNDTPVRVDVRILAATNRNIDALVRENKFPGDLYDRLSCLLVHVPSLRERKEDIPVLANHFVRSLCEHLPLRYQTFRCITCVETGTAACLGTQLMPLLKEYNWPGNVRELRNVVIQMITACEGVGIDIQHLPQRFADSTKHVPDGCEVSDLRMTSVMRGHMVKVLDLAKWNKSQAARMLGLPLSTLVSKMAKLKITPPK